jgi:RND superfamily putative drug exporter
MDVEHYATRDRNVIIPLVLVVVLIILALLLRAVVAPLVLIDTIIVRSVLVTALNLDLGDRMWWPGRLSRPSGQVTGSLGTPVTTAHR